MIISAPPFLWLLPPNIKAIYKLREVLTIGVAIVHKVPTLEA